MALALRRDGLVLERITRATTYSQKSKIAFIIQVLNTFLNKNDGDELPLRETQTS